MVGGGWYFMHISAFKTLTWKLFCGSFASRRKILILLFVFDFYILWRNWVLHFTFSFQIVPECARTYFLYDGKCYSTCPERTFIVPEKVVADNVRSKGLSVKRRASNIDEFDNLQDIIGRTESLVENRAIMLSSAQKLCGSCHESCLKCNGPLESDCVICDLNYNQIIIGSNISCDQKSNNVTLIESIQQGINEHSVLKIAFISALIGILLFTSCISICLLRRKQKFDKALSPEKDGKFSAKYSYNQLMDNEEKLLAKLNQDESDDE